MVLNRATILRTAARIQGAYYVGTGLWPVVHMRSFEAITGPKRDEWLVKTVGLLLAVAGSALLADPTLASRSTRVVAGGSAVTLAGVDVDYVARRTIRPVYLLDAAAEAGLLAALAIGMAEAPPRR